MYDYNSRNCFKIVAANTWRHSTVYSEVYHDNGKCVIHAIFFSRRIFRSLACIKRSRCSDRDEI